MSTEGRELRVMGGGRALRGGRSADLALAMLGRCRYLCRCSAAGSASTDGQFCNLYKTKDCQETKKNGLLLSV